MKPMCQPFVIMAHDLPLWAKIRSICEEKKWIPLQQTDSRKVHGMVGEKKPALVIIDLEAPYVDPLGTLISLKKDPTTAKIPVLGLLSHLESDIFQKASRLACDLILPRADFSQNIRDILSRYAPSFKAKHTAFFDVDRTLMNGFSGFYATLELIRRGILKKRRLPLAIFYQLMSRIQHGNVRKIYQIACEDMAGCQIDEIMEIGRECFERSVRPRLYSEAIEKIKEHKERSDKIVLLTSGPYMVVQILADFLGADQAYCPGPVVMKGTLEPEIREPICYREGKVIFAEQVEKETGISLGRSYYYADDMTDLPLLERVGCPTVVNAGSSLSSVARERSWPILRWKNILGKGAS